MFVDKAGTPGAILDDNDMYPWGGVVPGVGKTTSTNTIKFTGQYRDTDTAANLDYFGARYYSNTIGRFMSPDWAAKPTMVPYAKFGDPQSLNLYSYVENGPINRIDADGHCFTCIPGEAGGAPTDSPGQDKSRAPDNPATAPKRQPVTQVTLLGNTLTITYAQGMSADDQLAASDKITAVVKLLNSNDEKLTKDEKGALGNIKTIDVDPTASRSSVDAKTGTFHVNSDQLSQGTARLATDLAHDGFHITQQKAGRGYSGAAAEREATNFQIGVGTKIGLSKDEIKYLQNYADHIEDYKNYWNSPVKHPSDK